MAANTFNDRDAQRIGAAVRAHETRQVPDLPPPSNGPNKAIMWAKVTTAWKPNQANPNLVPVVYIFADGTTWTPPSGATGNDFNIYVSWPPTAKPTSPILASVLALNALVPFVPFGLKYNSESWGLLATMVPNPACIPGKITANGGGGSYTVELLTMAMASYSPTISITATEINAMDDIPLLTKIFLSSDGTNYQFWAGSGYSSGQVDEDYTNEHAEAARTGLGWTRGADAKTLKTPALDGIAYHDSGDEKLYEYRRHAVYDSMGRLKSKPATETRTEIDTPEACT